MPIQRRLSAVALLCALPLLICFAAAPLTSCAGLMPLIHDVATVVADVTGALDAVEHQVEARADADPQLVATVIAAIAKARAALRVVQAAARATDSVVSKDYLAAVDALLDAYDAVTQLAKSLGVLQAPARARARLGGPPGVTLVPTAAEIRADLLQPEGRS
jgi:hypothetical protein